MKASHKFILGALLWHALLCWACIAQAESKSRTLLVLEALPVHVTDQDEEPESRAERLRGLASAIDAATADPELRRALVVILRFETNAARYVQEDRCSDGPRGERECDGGNARGPWQLQGNVPESIEEQAQMAARLWSYHRKRCRSTVPDEVAGAYSGFGTGGKCSWAGAERRAEYHRQLQGRL